MNFLEMAQRLRQEAGYASGPTSVIGQSGDSLRFVTWISDSWLAIQRMRPNWDFMRSEMTLSFSASDATETLPSDFNRVDRDSIVVIRSDESRTYPSYVEPYAMRLIKRKQVDNESLPVYVTADSGTCEVFPTPVEVFTLKADYFTTPVTLAVNTDEPSLPEEYHMAIVYFAMMSFGAYDEAGNAWQHAASRYTQLMNEITMTQLPQLTTGAALA